MDPPTPVVSEAEKYKNEGNKALSAGELDLAIELYGLGINVDEENHILYSNRSAAYAKKGMWNESLADATKCVFLKPDWAKGYLRKGQALQQLGKYKDAQFAFQKGATLDPNDQLIKQGLMQVNMLAFQQAQEEAEKKKLQEEEEKKNPKPEPPKPPTIAELRQDLAEMSPKQLKEILAQANIDAADCYEKQDLIDKIIRHSAYSRPEKKEEVPPAKPVKEEPKDEKPPVSPKKQAPEPPPKPESTSPREPKKPEKVGKAPVEDKASSKKPKKSGESGKKEETPATDSETKPKPEPNEENEVKGAFDDDIDYYKLLGVEKTATSAEIKKAYYKQAQQCHPDKTDDPKAEEQFKLISEAYNVLMDEEKRKTYDKFGRKKVQEMGSGDGSEMMAMMVRMIFGGGAFDDTFGELSMIEQMSPDFEKKYEGKSEAEIHAIMTAENEKRVEALANILVEKLAAREGGGDKAWESILPSLLEKVDAPGGPALLGLIGYIYISEGKKRLLGGTFAGWAAGWNDTKAMVSLVGSAMKAQQAAEDMEKGKPVDEEAAVGAIFDTMWKFGKWEIINIVRAVCSAAFKKKLWPKFSKKKRAQALKSLGGLYKAASKRAMKEKGFEKGTFFEGLAKEADEEAQRPPQSEPNVD